MQTIFHPAYQLYNFGPEHPFSPVRLQMLTELLAELGHPIAPYPLQPASREDVLKVHAERLIKRVEAASQGQLPPDLEHYGLSTADTPVFANMDVATRWLVGGTLEAAKQVMAGQKTVLQLGGGLHHAQFDRASGFCVYNDLSVAIRYLTDQGLRVAYLDIDVHHGDGVQWIHYDEPHVLTISLHESGRYLFPGTGNVYEVGRGNGVGRKLNLPLEPFTEGESYLENFEALMQPALAWFRPDVLLVQTGADAHALDPLAELLLTTHTYANLFQLIEQLANSYVGGRVIYTLGGGYSLDSAIRVWAVLYLHLAKAPLPYLLPEDWRLRWEKRLGQELTPTLHDIDRPYATIPRKPQVESRNRNTLSQLLEAVRPHWT